MKITQDNQGWQIEPSTNEEEEHLRYLLDALQKTYGVSVNAPGIFGMEENCDGDSFIYSNRSGSL